MTEPTSFEEYLAVDESAVAVGSGTLFQATAWTPSAVCVTDRRILFVPAEGGFVDVPRRQVLSIRSRPTRRRTGRAIVGLGLLVAGAVLAVLAAWTLSTAGGVAVPAFALLATVGAVATGWLVSSGVELDGGQVSAAIDAVETSLGDLLGSVDDRFGDRIASRRVPGDVAVPPRVESVLVAVADDRPVLRWLAAGVGLLGAGGLVFLGAWTALGLTTMGLAGIGATAQARAYERALEDRDGRIRRERSVCLYLLDGRTVRFRIADDASIDRELRTLTARGPTASFPGDAASADDGPAETGASTGP
jgi:hypothetical protein